MAEKKIINTELQPIDKLLDSSGDAGTSGQILSSTGSGTNWITSSSGTITGSGSQNYIPLWSSGTVLTNSIISSSGGDVTINGSDDNPYIYINPAGGDIGDTARVQFNSRGWVGYIGGFVELGDAGQSKDIRLRVNTAQIYFQTSNTTRMTITTAGNVGIGTQSPSEKLSISGGNIAVANGSSIMIGGSIADTKIGKLYNVSGVLSLDGDGTRNIRLGSTTNGEVVRIDNTNGRVGVGTNSPSAKLHVSGSDSTASAIRQSRTGISRIWDQAIDSSGRLQWGYRATEGGTRTVTFSLDDNNFVGIGAGAASPSYPLYVYNADAPSDIVAKFHTGDNSTYIQLTSAGSSWQIGATSDSLDWYNDNNTAVRMSLLETGNLGIATTAPNEKLEVSGNIRVSGSYKVGATDVITSGRRFYAADGSTASPAYSFSDRTDTGMYADDHGSNDRIHFSIDGNERFYIDANGIASLSNIYSGATGQFRNYSGIWRATTGTSGNGFIFTNTADSSDVLSITSSSSGATASVATFGGKARSQQTASGDDATTLTTKSYVDGLVTGVTRYMGLWDASSGTGGNPDLTASTYKVPGYYFIVSVAGSATPNGAGTEPNTWHVGDWVIWSDQATDAWQKIDNTSVLSGTGTANKVAMWNGDESLTNAPITISGNNSNFTGNIGIGVTPSAPLHIAGTSGSVAGQSILFNGSTAIWQPSDATLTIRPSGTDAATFSNTSTTFLGEIKLQLSSTVQRALSRTGTESMQIGDAGIQMLRFKNAVGVALDIEANGTLSVAKDINMTDGELLMWGGNSILTHSGSATTIGDDSSGSVITVASGVSTFAGNIRLDDNSGASPNVQFVNGANASWFIYNDSNGKFQVQQSSDIRATFSSGDLEVRTPLKVSAGAVSISSDGANYATLTESDSGDLTISAVDDIRLDSGGEDIVLRGSSSQEFGRLTNNSGNFNITGSDIKIDASGDITLDADGNDIRFMDNTVEYGKFKRDSGDFNIYSSENDKDMKFIGQDNNSDVTALRLDMSDSGWAYFNTGADFDGHVKLAATKKLYFTQDGTNNYIVESSDNVLDFVSAGVVGLQLSGTSADMRSVNFNGNITTETDSTFNIGSTSKRFANIWVDNINGGTPTTGGPYLPLAGGTITGGVTIVDDVGVLFGTGGDSFIKHTGAQMSIYNDTGHMYMVNRANDKNIYFQSDDGSGGTTTYFRVDGAGENVQYAKNLLLYDNVQLLIGSGGDLQVYHNGATSYIRNNTGNLEIRNQTSAASDLLLKSTTDSGLETFMTLDGSATEVVFSKNIHSIENIYVGDNKDLYIFHNGNDSYIQHVGTGDLFIKQTVTDRDITFFSDNGSGGETEYFRMDGSAVQMFGSVPLKLGDGKELWLGNASDFYLSHDGTNNFIIAQNGPLYIRQSQDDENIYFQCDDGSGGVTEYFRLDGTLGYTVASKQILFNDDVKARFGNSGDMEIFHDGSHSRIKDVGSGHLVINATDFVVNNSADTKNMIIATDGSSVDLYYNASKKFETTNTGISVTGVVADRDIPCLFNSNFSDGTSSTIQVVPFNSLTEVAVSSRTYYHNITMPYAGKLTKVVMKNVSGSPSSSFTTQLFFYVNGSQQASSAELTISSDKIEWSPTASNTFSAGDELSFGYQKSASNKTWSGVSYGVAIELTDYDI